MGCVTIAVFTLLDLNTINSYTVVTIYAWSTGIDITADAKERTRCNFVAAKRSTAISPGLQLKYNIYNMWICFDLF